MRWILGLAAIAALTACNRNIENKSASAPAASGANDTAAATPAGSTSFTKSDLVGRWGAPTENCGYSTTYGADGTFKDHLFDGSVGGSGKWTLAGDTITLAYSDGRSETQRIVEWKGDTHVSLVGDPPIKMIRRRCAPV